MRLPGARKTEHGVNRDKPALVAFNGFLGALWHPSSAVSVPVVVLVAHLLAVRGADQADTVFGASFAVFALLLPAVALLRDYFNKRTDRMRDMLRERNKVLGERAGWNPQQADNNLAASIQAEWQIFHRLRAQSMIFERLRRAVSPLQRGVALTIVATLASSAAIVVPTFTLWPHAPRWLVFNPAQLLTAIALVCLAGTAIAMLPFTWYLLIGPEEVKEASETASVPQPPAPQPGTDDAAPVRDPPDPAPGTPAPAANATGTLDNSGSRTPEPPPGPVRGPEVHHGRATSWAAVSIIITGFIVGGIAMAVGPTWWLFWVGAGIVAIGGIFARSGRIVDDWY
jgi:hypothetical protein